MDAPGQRPARTRKQSTTIDADEYYGQTKIPGEAGSTEGSSPRGQRERQQRTGLTIARNNSRAKPSGKFAAIPKHADDANVGVDGGSVRLRNLRKIFWPARGLTKRDLLQYYLEASQGLLPHVRDRAMVMKRYPNGFESARSNILRGA